jgi:mannose-6-phosphate isomerase-like protein (cupin superfamily)
LANSDADTFVNEFFPGLDPAEARLGNEDAELSPKILLVSPAQRLSWQHHDRRAERWAFVTTGGYHKSTTDDQGELHSAKSGEVVQFAQGERHRLVGAIGHYTLVAEIWQHVDNDHPSDEADIVRLQDDYDR